MAETTDREQRIQDLESQRADLVARIDWIQSNPGQYARQRVQSIDRALQGGNGRPPITQRTPTTPGNVSMYDHLQALRVAWSEDPNPNRASKAEIEMLRGQVAEIDAALERLGVTDGG